MPMDIFTLQQIEDQLKVFMQHAQKPLVVVMGPTASGKSRLAVDLAKAFHGEVINADSRQVYQEIVVGNALTSEEEMQGVPHHLFSHVPLSWPYNVAQYKAEAESKIEDIQARGKLPILCGGTFLWIDAVVDNFSIPVVEPDMGRREELEQLDVESLLEQLSAVDPEGAVRLREDRNKRSIIRALEIYRQTGQTKSALASRGERKVQVFKVAPFWEREQLYERIDQRAEVQLHSGLIEEVGALIDRYADGIPERLLELRWPSLTSIGCKELVPYWQGVIHLEQLLVKLQQVNRNYAKRQLTWLRRDDEIRWLRW